MKLSKETIKRIVLILIVVGLFELYDVAKKHSRKKQIEAQQTAYIPKNTAQLNAWFKDKYASEILNCVPDNKNNTLDPYLVKLAYLYQSQIDNVRHTFPNAKKEDQAVVAQNQFYAILHNHIESFTKDYAPKKDQAKYVVSSLAETLKSTPYDPYINAAIHRIGGSDTRQTESFSLAVNNAGIANKSHIVETKYFNLPSIQVAHNLLLAQFNEDEKSRTLKNYCFNILENHPSVAKQNN